ncbi:hypothetical protein [Clostridium vincentii]|uniref:Lipoprotein n=1 Tax=Clostridium vincentii TaxID=52704 RepID=A0A2T0BHC3_9CLOT|nr:hypothetical protein [Clostridium vincentii]PRR83265.1 hypothetical protein CLVI_10640 [Clostridium vincentii]
MKKFFIGILCLILVFTIVACNASMEEVTVHLFDIKEAMNTGSEYMKNLALGNIEEANSYCRNKDISEEEVVKMQENKINSYKLDQAEEGANYAYLKYIVLRGNTAALTADLDGIVLKIMKEDDKYLIDDIKVSSIKQVYKEKDTLRIRDEESGKTKLLLRMRDLPREIYPKKEEVTLSKETVPESEFNKISIGFEGNRVAITLTEGDNTFIAVAMIKEIEATVGQSDGKENVDMDTNLDEILEKPIAERIVGYDFLQDEEVEKLLFSKDDGELIIQGKQEGLGNRVKIYKNPKGELMPLKLDELFPREAYSVNIFSVTGEGTFINVEAIGEEKEAAGTYIVDVKEGKLVKSSE